MVCIFGWNLNTMAFTARLFMFLATAVVSILAGTNEIPEEFPPGLQLNTRINGKKLLYW